MVVTIISHFISKPVRCLKGFGTDQIRKFDFSNYEPFPDAGEYVDLRGEPVSEGDHVTPLLKNADGGRHLL